MVIISPTKNVLIPCAAIELRTLCVIGWLDMDIVCELANVFELMDILFPMPSYTTRGVETLFIDVISSTCVHLLAPTAFVYAGYWHANGMIVPANNITIINKYS
jgi:hypothetical protein